MIIVNYVKIIGPFGPYWAPIRPRKKKSADYTDLYVHFGRMSMGHANELVTQAWEGPSSWLWLCHGTQDLALWEGAKGPTRPNPVPNRNLGPPALKA